MDEAGMSLSANFLTRGCDCRGEIFAFDGTLNDSVGRAMTILNAVCRHEVDYSMAWKHTDCRTQEVAVRRSRR
jgi:primary-amine oxidase